MVAILILVLLASFGTKETNSADWCYLDEHCEPKKWNGTCSSGRSQSPIDLTLPAVTVPENLDIELSDAYCNETKGIYIRNSGHSVEMWEEVNAVDPSIFMKGTAFGTSTNPGRTYEFYQLHFHWGSNDSVGSEHTVAGKAYPMELHMVHVLHNDNSPEAAAEIQTLAVLGIFFEVSGDENPALKPILDAFTCVNNTGVLMPYLFKTINLVKLLPKDKTIYRYDGSLTTPPCNETVLWSVFKEPVKMSAKQMKLFREIETSANDKHHSPKLSDNFRPVKDLNGRTIKSAVLTVTGICAGIL